MSSEIARTNMISQQLRTGNVLDEAVLQLYVTIPREEFVPNEFKPFAYSDMQIALAHEQCMMTPLEEAKLLQSLQLQGHEVILEIGTGTGFLTALLSKRCQKVISVDCHASFTSQARQKLSEYQCHNVELVTEDASRGRFAQAPYEIIIITSAIEAITDTLRLQVLAGGKLFAIVGKGPVMQGQLHTLSHDGQWQEELVFETCVPPLIDTLKPKEFVF